MLIADEVHNLGSDKLSDSLSDVAVKVADGAFDFDLEEHYDEEGTRALFDYFGEPVFEYSLSDAIRLDHLTKYHYYPILVDLNEEKRMNIGK